MRKPKAEAIPKNEKTRRQNLDAVEKAMSGFGSPRSVLKPIVSVPTVMVQLDHALKVGGWPTERIAGIHGPTHEGKTLATLLLILSFLLRDHFVLLNDTEHTTDIDWVSKLLGGFADSPYFKASRTAIYEDAVDEVRTFLELVEDLRAKKKVPKETRALVVIDSLRKLVPKDLFKKIVEGKGGIDGASGRGEQIKARYNAAWMDELVPLVARTGGTMVFVLREHEDTEADAWSRKFGNNYKVGGGKAVQFDSSILMRVTRASWVKDGSGDDARVIGERHRMTVRKSKVAGKEGKVSVAYFHSSNGKLVPEGHDRARDVLDLAERFGLVEKQTPVVANKDVKRLNADADALIRLEAKVREEFERKAPVEYDEETGEIAGGDDL